MKIQKFVLVVVLIIGITGVSKAQYCDFFAMTKGMTLSYQSFDKKEKITSSSKTTYLDVITDSTQLKQK